jgi:hypothetical protein
MQFKSRHMKAAWVQMRTLALHITQLTYPCNARCSPRPCCRVSCRRWPNRGSPCCGAGSTAVRTAAPVGRADGIVDQLAQPFPPMAQALTMPDWLLHLVCRPAKSRRQRTIISAEPWGMSRRHWSSSSGDANGGTPCRAPAAHIPAPAPYPNVRTVAAS